MSGRRRLALFTSILTLLAVTLTVAPGRARACVLDVDYEADDAFFGDGFCSLREAILNANTDGRFSPDCPAGSGPDRINLAPGTYTLAIAGSDEDFGVTGDLDITDDLTISGAGAAITVIDGGALDRVIDVHIGKLRQKIEPEPARPAYILTVHGIGYKSAESMPG